MDAAAADLGARQLRILRRVADLELAAQQHRLGALSISAAPSGGEAETGATEARLSSILTARGVLDFTFRRVPADYYDRPLEERRDLLRADSVDQLCKSIVMVNTQAAADVVDCSNPKNSKYYVVVVQAGTRRGVTQAYRVIIDEAITKLDKDFFWLGGGEVDLKLGVRTSQFLNAFKPFVVKCS
uniref:YbaK/aminoacyl-tRNA synthetase-associated domain-containing protein n=1 Tax=Oryza meridionalis TaxID=40149 RepID=A0A0E0CPE7_9ORYZ